VSRILVQDAELDGKLRADVRIARGVVVEIAPKLPPQSGEHVIEAKGGALLPGFCDHHLHLFALAAWHRSVLCDSSVEDLRAALADAHPDEHGWIRGVGFSEAAHGDLDAHALDLLHDTRPVRIQHRGGAMWVVNTRAAKALGLAQSDHPGIERDHRGVPTGRLYRADDWLRARLAHRSPDLGPVGTRLTRLGITTVTDASADLDQSGIDIITTATATRTLPQNVFLLGVPLGWHAPDLPHAPKAGPFKIVLADSGLPDFDQLTDRIREVHSTGRAVAVHCVTREALVLLLAAFGEAGTLAGDRVEHASLVPAELVPEINRLRLRIVTQPGFLAHRGDDFLRAVPENEHADLYRARTLIKAGIPTAVSSDAPYGPLDPWTVLNAAVRRMTSSGRVAGPAECLTVDQALAGYLSPPDNPGGPPRRLRPGAVADLTLLGVPRAHLLTGAAEDFVRATIIRGELAYTHVD
jgi:predicted amidohydrolase YtcJ